MAKKIYKAASMNNAEFTIDDSTDILFDSVYKKEELFAISRPL